MDIKKAKAAFESETEKNIYGSHKLVFSGCGGYDVYNPSEPFEFNGKRYIFGRVEERSVWACSHTRMFEETKPNQWTAVDNVRYQLEDPFITYINGEWIFGGVHVIYVAGKYTTYYCYFYRGKDIFNLKYFTTGPDYMKDIRLVQMPDNKIGVFSRPRNDTILKQYGCASMVGFTVIDDILKLTPDVIENAPLITGLFDKDEWGGCNQAVFLESGMVGVIGHQCYDTPARGKTVPVYVNFSFVLDPVTLKTCEQKVIGTRRCYPAGPAKQWELEDVAFTSGIVERKDGKVDLYSGLSDAEAGYITIDNPFKNHGKILFKQKI